MSSLFYKRLACRLQRARRRRGLTQRGLARMSSLPVDTVRSVESGFGRGHTYEIVAIAKILNVRIDATPGDETDRDCADLVDKYEKIDAIFEAMMEMHEVGGPKH